MLYFHMSPVEEGKSGLHSEKSWTHFLALNSAAFLLSTDRDVFDSDSARHFDPSTVSHLWRTTVTNCIDVVVFFFNTLSSRVDFDS